MNRGEHAEYISTPEWVARRNRFKKKHGYFCDACGAREHLEVHHVRYTNAGAGLEPNRDLRVLCDWDHELAHIYEKSGEYGGFKKRGTLVRATEAMIADVQSGLVPVPVGRPASRTRPDRVAPLRPQRRTDTRRPRSRSRRKHSAGSTVVGVVVAVVVLLLVIPSLGRSTQPPAQEQSVVTASAETSAVVVPALPPPPAPYVVQAGDTLQRIADQSGVSLTDLLSWNPAITDPNYIEVGQSVVTAAPAG